MRVALCRFACARPRSCCALSQPPRARSTRFRTRAPRASTLALRWRLAGALRSWLARALPCTRHTRAMQRPLPGRHAHECAPAQPRRSMKISRCRSGRSGREKDRPREDDGREGGGHEGRVAAAGEVAAVSRERRAETTALEAKAASQVPQPAAQGTGAGQFVSGGRTNAAIARWADIALAGGAGRAFTCHSPRLGRVGHVGHAKRMDARALAQLERLSRSPCLWAATPVAVKRARCQVRWCAEAEGSGRRASGVGGAQKAGQGAPPALVF